MTRNHAYFASPQLGGASPREIEALALGLCNDRLAKAATPRARVEALHKNHQLWSLLVRDLLMPGNRLPAELKQELRALGLWAMAYSTRAITDNLPLTPLIAVNRNIIDGLRMASPAAAPAPSPGARAPGAAWA